MLFQFTYRGLCAKDSFRYSKAKMIEKPEFTGVNKDFKILSNAAGVGAIFRAKVSCMHFA